MNRLILVGSPRSDGRSAALAEQLFDACVDECPQDAVTILSVASLDVRPCIGCDLCYEPVDEWDESNSLEEVDATADESNAAADEDLSLPYRSVSESDASLHQCIYDDEFAVVRQHLDACDELTVVTPVYFASAPSQFKVWLDRMQPYFWSTLRTKPKRPLILHVVGEGGDPYGFDPLIATTCSALACAGFSLERVLDWVGKISPVGEILEDAEVYPYRGIGLRDNKDASPEGTKGESSNKKKGTKGTGASRKGSGPGNKGARQGGSRNRKGHQGNKGNRG